MAEPHFTEEVVGPLDLDMDGLSRLDFLMLLQGIADRAGLELVRRTFHLPEGVKHESLAVRQKAPRGSSEPTT